MQHGTHSEKSHTHRQRRRVLYWQQTIRMHTFDNFTWLAESFDRPANISIGFWFGFVFGIWYSERFMFRFHSPCFSDAEVAESGQQALTVLHTLSIESKMRTTYSKKCIQFVHTQRKLPAICIWCTARTLSFSLDLLLRSFFEHVFFVLLEFMCIEQIVCSFRWTIVDFRVRECIYLCVYDWYDLIEKHRYGLTKFEAKLANFQVFDFISSLNLLLFRMGIECKYLKISFHPPVCALCARAISACYMNNCRIVWVAKLELASCCTVEKLSSPSLAHTWNTFHLSWGRCFHELKTENSNCVIKNMKRWKRSKQQLATKHFVYTHTRKTRWMDVF